MEKSGKEPPNRLGSNVSQINRSDLRNSPNFVGSHEFQVLSFPYNVRDSSIETYLMDENVGENIRAK